MGKGNSDSGGVILAREPVRRAVVLEAERPVRGFPRDLRDVKVLKTLGGSTGAQLVEDSKGNRFVMKKGNSPDHLREEASTDAIYRAAGVDVPEFRLYETKGGPVKLAKFKTGTPLSDLAGPARDKAYSDLAKNFALDAVLGNWDVVGLGFDNVLVVGGKPYRIDNGGALRYRAQGGLKSALPKAAHFDSVPNEIFTLRDPKVNAQTAKVFGKLSYKEVLQQGLALYKKKAKIVQAAPPELRATISARIDSLYKLAENFGSRAGEKGQSPQRIEEIHKQAFKVKKGG